MHPALRWIGLNDVPVFQVVDEQPVASGFEDTPVLLLLFAQLLLRSRLLGNIADHG